MAKTCLGREFGLTGDVEGRRERQARQELPQETRDEEVVQHLGAAQKKNAHQDRENEKTLIAGKPRRPLRPIGSQYGARAGNDPRQRDRPPFSPFLLGRP